MQTAIEDLMRAYSEDKRRETEVILDLLTAMAVGAAARQRMLNDLSKAVSSIKTTPTENQAELSQPASGHKVQ